MKLTIHTTTSMQRSRIRRLRMTSLISSKFTHNRQWCLRTLRPLKKKEETLSLSLLLRKKVRNNSLSREVRYSKIWSLVWMLWMNLRTTIMRKSRDLYRWTSNRKMHSDQLSLIQSSTIMNSLNRKRIKWVQMHTIIKTLMGSTTNMWVSLTMKPSPLKVV